MSIGIYVDFEDKTGSFLVIKGTTTFRDIENQFLKLSEFKDKQIYGMYNTYPSDIIHHSLSTPPPSLDGPLTSSILIITDLITLNPDAKRMYNFYNETPELGFEYAQRNSLMEDGSYIYRKSPMIDEKTDMLAATAAPAMSQMRHESAASTLSSSSSLTFTKEDTELIKTVTSDNFDIFQTCLINIVGYDDNCLSQHVDLVTKLRDAIFGNNLEEIIANGKTIEGVIAKLNSLQVTKGGRRKSHKKPRRKSFRKKKRRSTHHKKNVFRR